MEQKPTHQGNKSQTALSIHWDALRRIDSVRAQQSTTPDLEARIYASCVGEAINRGFLEEMAPYTSELARALMALPSPGPSASDLPDWLSDVQETVSARWRSIRDELLPQG